MKTFKTVSAFIESWCLWMAVTSIGWLIGYSLASYLAQSTSLEIPNEVAIGISVMCGGGVVALMQWQYLGPKVSGIGNWALFSACGLTFGFSITTIIYKITGSLSGAIVSGVLGGFVLGFFQWFGLRSDARRKIPWILMTVFGWALASDLGMLIFAQGDISRPPNTFQEVVGSWTMGSVVVSLVTVIALVMLFPKSIHKDPRTRIKWSF
jgi:hypothetical protein